MKIHYSIRKRTALERFKEGEFNIPLHTEIDMIIMRAYFSEVGIVSIAGLIDGQDSSIKKGSTLGFMGENRMGQHYQNIDFNKEPFNNPGRRLIDIGKDTFWPQEWKDKPLITPAQFLKLIQNEVI